MSENSAVRARPTMMLASSSGRMRAGSAWFMQPSASSTSDSSEANSFSRISLRSANGASCPGARAIVPWRRRVLSSRQLDGGVRCAPDSGGRGRAVEVSLDLLSNAIVSGLLLGGFYAAVTIGVSISFGMLDIVNIAHPAFIVLGSYMAYLGNTLLGLDPIVSGIA